MSQSARLATSPLVFTVRRKKHEILCPAKPTPHEFKPLSDIDDQETLRFQVPVIQFYKNDASMTGKRDPVPVIREAIAKTLVFYYPFAGRLREGPARKLVVDCTGEGVVFIEADADVELKDFGNEELHPPLIPCLDQLLHVVPDSSGILDCPLLLIQVTRLRCGGFILAIRVNHTMSDAPGFFQFLTAVGEMARGATAPSVLPVWQRELLNARDPPRATYAHHEYDQAPPPVIPFDDQEIVQQSFFFGPDDIFTLRRAVYPVHLCQKKFTTFDILVACMWRCRTIALQFPPTEEVRFAYVVNARRSSRFHPPLPAGYYGNAFAFPAAKTTAGELCLNPLKFALELVSRTKSEFSEEYMQSVADLMVMRGRPPFAAVTSTYLVSDNTRIGWENVDYGWGKAIYGGPAEGGIDPVPAGVVTFYVASVTARKRGEEGIVVPVALPAPAMERFKVELNKIMLTKDGGGGGGGGGDDLLLENGGTEFFVRSAI